MTKQDGLLIAVEGIDGCGKSTFIRNLSTLMTPLSYEFIVTKQPGGTPLGILLRDIIMKKEVPLCTKAEFLLFASDRAQHFDELVLPALKENKIVISDRMGDSSIIYQGFARGLDIKKIKEVNEWAMAHRDPDIVFYIDVDVQTAFDRVVERKEELTQFEREKEGFMKKVQDSFNELFKDRENVVRLDGNQLPDTLAQQALAVIEKKYEKVS